MSLVLATIGAKALYLLFLWLGSAIAASWLSARKGYGERWGLAAGLLLSVLGVVIWIVLYFVLPQGKGGRDTGERKPQPGQA